MVPPKSLHLDLLSFQYKIPHFGEIIKKHNVKYHFDADDGQLYLSFQPNNILSQHEARNKMMECAREVKYFLTTNKMKQSNDKTEFMIIGMYITPGQHRKVQFNNINICEANISASDKARNLGVLFDRELNINLQVNNICKSGFFHIRNLCSIRNMLHTDSATMAAHAFVISL